MNDLQVPSATLPRGRTGSGIQIVAHNTGSYIASHTLTNIPTQMQTAPGHVHSEVVFNHVIKYRGVVLDFCCFLLFSCGRQKGWDPNMRAYI